MIGRLIATCDKHFLKIDLSVVVILSAVFSYLHNCHVATGVAIDATLMGNRAAIYGTFASVFGALLGFTISAVSILLTVTSTPLFKRLHKHPEYQSLWTSYKKALFALSVATITSVLALILDKDSSPRWCFVDPCAVTAQPAIPVRAGASAV